MNKPLKIALTATVVSALALSSFAAGTLVSINVDPSIKILVNGQEFNPKDVNGNDVMTFTYNGTTYAPLRALAEAYGLEVGYDSEKKMATVGTVEKIPSSSDVIAHDGYKSGNYKVGVDIPAGVYILFPNDADVRAYFSYSSDANGNDIIENDNFEGNSIIEIHDNEYLELSRCTAYPLDSAPTIQTTNGYFTDGFYIVGVHIPAGEYKIETTDNTSGYYCLYNDIRREDIDSNDNFENSRYISVQEGQYLLLSRCKVKVD